MRALLVDLNPFGAPVTPISLGYVGASLVGSGHEVKVLSLGSTSLFSPASFLRFLKEFSPGIVGFGAYQRNIFYINSLADMVKQALPESVVVFGGPHATFLPDEALSALPSVDYLSRGEGESVILKIAEAVESGAGNAPVPGTTSRDGNGGYVTGPNLTVPADLDDYPSPWLSGVLDPSDMDEAIMLTSRGCPFKCAFCYTPAAFAGKVRANSVERVLEDIEHVARNGSGRMWFADPNFSFSRKRVVQILEGIARQGLDVNMWVETRADMLDKELIDLMKRAGVYMLAMGLESASENVYPHLNKNLDPDRIRKAVELALTAGLDVELFSQFALPYERYDDAIKTLNFVKDAGVKIRGNSNAQQMQLYFGSKIASDPARFGVKPLRDDLPAYSAIGTEFETEWMTADEIEKVKNAWRAESLDGGKRVVS